MPNFDISRPNKKIQCIPIVSEQSIYYIPAENNCIYTNISYITDSLFF